MTEASFGRRRVPPHGSVARDTDFARPPNRTLELVEDPVYVARLKAKLLQLLTDDGPNGTVVLNGAFQRLDRQFRCTRSDFFALDVWGFKRFLSPLGFSDTEAEVIFALFLDEEDRAVAFLGDPDSARSVAPSSSAYDRLSTSSHAAGTSALPTVDAGEVMLAIRKLCHNVSSQFHEILKKLRARRLSPGTLDSGGRLRWPFFQAFQETGRPIRRRELFRFLVEDMNLTDSEGFLVLEYCSHDQTPQSHADGDSPEEGLLGRGPTADPSPAVQQSHANELDTEYIVSVLFDESLPDDVAFPLLMSKYVESVTNPAHGDGSGITAVLEALLLSLESVDAAGRPLRSAPPSHSVDLGEGVVTSLTKYEQLRAAEASWAGGTEGNSSTSIPYAAALEARWLDVSLFKHLSQRLQVGMPMVEVELLFRYLADCDSGLLQMSRLVQELIARCPRIPPPELHRVTKLIQRQLMRSTPSNPLGAHGINELHRAFAVFEDRPIPPLSFRFVFRSLGVDPSTVPTVMLDAIRAVFPRCVALVSLLRGPVPPARTEAMEKVYVLLLSDANLLPVSSSNVTPSSYDETPGSRPVALSPRRSARASVPVPVARHHMAAGGSDDVSALLEIPLPKSAVLRRFSPETATGIIPPADARLWREQLQHYLASLPDASSTSLSSPRSGFSAGRGDAPDRSVGKKLIFSQEPARGASAAQPSSSTKGGHFKDGPLPIRPLPSSLTGTILFSEFVYFWANVSLAYDDDAEFQLLLWKVFVMHRDKLSEHRHTSALDTPPRTIADRDPLSKRRLLQD